MKSRSTTAALPACLVLLAASAIAHGAESPARPAAPPPGTQATVASAAPGGVVALAGRWTVDLRPSPDAPAYDKPMVLDIDPDGSVRGSFYDSTIESGRAGASNGRVCFAFRTTDGVGPYHTSGCLVAGRIVGQTWAEHRRFVLNWVAVRE